MRVSVTGLAAVCAVVAQIMLSAGAGATAAEIEGVIQKMDTNIGAIILTDGTTIMLPAEFNVDGLDPGKKIYIDYDMVDGKKEAQIIEIIEE